MRDHKIDPAGYEGNCFGHTIVSSRRGNGHAKTLSVRVPFTSPGDATYFVHVDGEEVHYGPDFYEAVKAYNNAE